MCSEVNIPQPRWDLHSSSPKEISPTPREFLASSSAASLSYRHQPLFTAWHALFSSVAALLPQMQPDIRDWTDARLRRFLRGKAIPFHRNNNRTRLFHLYLAYINTLATTTSSASSSAQHQFHFRAAHILGHHNNIGNSLSCLSFRNSDTGLQNQIFMPYQSHRFQPHHSTSSTAEKTLYKKPSSTVSAQAFSQHACPALISSPTLFQCKCINHTSNHLSKLRKRVLLSLPRFS